MGNDYTKYQDGDIPRDNFDLDIPEKGWVYYKSQIEGNCKTCDFRTTYWFISIKEKGKYLCEDCRSLNIAKNKEKLSTYQMGYGSIRKL